MLVKLAPDDQVLLPKQALDALGRPSHFDVIVEGDRLILLPTTEAAEARKRLAQEIITDQDIAAAVEWARNE